MTNKDAYRIARFISIVLTMFSLFATIVLMIFDPLVPYIPVGIVMTSVHLLGYLFFMGLEMFDVKFTELPFEES